MPVFSVAYVATLTAELEIEAETEEAAEKVFFACVAEGRYAILQYGMDDAGDVEVEIECVEQIDSDDPVDGDAA